MHDIPEVKLINDQGDHQQECQFLLKEEKKKKGGGGRGGARKIK